MVVLFIIVVVGYLLRRIKIMDGEFDRKLSVFIIQVSCPCLILSSVMGDSLPEKNLILPLLIVGFVTYGILIILGIYFPKILPIPKTQRGLYSFMLTFGNVGFIGYPVVSAIFGPKAIFYAAVVNFPNTLLIFLVGIMFVTGGGEKAKFDWRLFFTPAMIASYLAMIIVVIGTKMPTVIAQPCQLLGNVTVPGALLLIGSSLSTVPVKKMGGSLPIYLMAAMRLIVAPLLIYYFFKLFNTDTMVNQVNAVICAMPVASYGTLFCVRYQKDVTVMSEGTFITTLLSVITIPLITLFL